MFNIFKKIENASFLRSIELEIFVLSGVNDYYLLTINY